MATFENEYLKAKSLVAKAEKHIADIKKSVEGRTVGSDGFFAENQAFQLSLCTEELASLLVEIGDGGGPENGR